MLDGLTPPFTGSYVRDLRELCSLCFKITMSHVGASLNSGEGITHLAHSTGFAAMPSRKDLRVIQGGKLTGVEPAIDQPLPIEATQLLERAARYRSLLPSKPDDDIAALVDDLEDAIKALQRLEQSTAPEAQPRASEYRRLIAEIDAEVLAALQADKGRRP